MEVDQPEPVFQKTGGNGEKAVALSNKKATGPVFKKANIWNGSSWMEVDQPEPVFQKANSRVQNWLDYIDEINILK